MKVHGRRAFLTMLSSILATKASSQDLLDLYQNSVSKKPFVSFMARRSPGAIGKPGHSFIGMGIELDNATLIYESLYGFYPDGEAYEVVKATYSTVQGKLDHKIEDVAWDIEFRVDLDDASRETVRGVIEEWRSDLPKYNLFANNGKNCSVFASEVAEALGLQVPDSPGTKLPVDYMKELKELNQRSAAP